MSNSTLPILLIEDDLSLLESLRGFLDDSGYQTQAASTCQSGQEMLRNLGNGICLLDLNLPDGSGIDLLRIIVAEKLEVRVIVMTAFPIQNLEQRFDGVVAAVMTKPVCPQHLIQWVDKMAGTT